nr:Unknown Function [uncultured bacterium]
MRARLRPRFLEHERHQQQPQHTGCRHYVEERPPVTELDDEAAAQRGQDWRHREHQHDQAHQLRRRRTGIVVAHDRPRQRHRRTRPHALHEAEEHQPFDAGSERCPHRADEENADAGIERRLAAEHVAQGAIDQLPDRESQHESHQALLHGAGRGGEIPPDGGECRQIHVDGQRSDYGQQAKHDSGANELGVHEKRSSD